MMYSIFIKRRKFFLFDLEIDRFIFNKHKIDKKQYQNYFHIILRNTIFLFYHIK